MLAPIVCQGRSGSTLLCDLMCSHSKIDGIREFFAQGRGIWQEYEGENLLEYMLDKFKGNNKPNSYFTTTYFHGHKVDIADDYLRYEKAKIVVLNRNLIDIALSDCLVQQSRRLDNCTHDESFRKPYKHPTIEIDTNYLQEKFKLYDMYMEWFPDRFEGLDIIEVRYEDLVKDRKGVCSLILDFLDLEYQELYLGIERPNPLVKQRTITREEAIINYEQLFNYFKGTIYEKYFHEENV